MVRHQAIKGQQEMDEKQERTEIGVHQMTVEINGSKHNELAKGGNTME